MPIIKSARKRVRQSEKSMIRNRHYKSRMLTLIKNVVRFAQKGESEGLTTKLSEACSSIDIAAKKRIIHKNNAARKKSRIARAVASMSVKSEGSELPTKKTAEKKTAKKAVSSQKAGTKKS